MLFTTLANELLNSIVKGAAFSPPTEWHISLHTADPGDSAASEVTGGSYARKVPTVGTVADKQVTTSAALTWADMPACTVTHAVLWGEGTRKLMRGVFTTPKVVLAGGTLTVESGDCIFTLV